MKTQTKTEKRGGGKGRHQTLSAHRRRWRGRTIKTNRKYPKPPRAFNECARCHEEFQPYWMEVVGIFSTCCFRCQVKNLANAMNFPKLLDMAGIPRSER